MIFLEATNLSEGVDVLIVGMLVVFVVLLLLFVFVYHLQNIATFFTKIAEGSSNTHTHTTETSSSKDSKQALTGQENAAISFALYLYFNELHDHESGVVTIKSVKKAYSPWSSKIYGLNNIIKR